MDFLSLLEDGLIGKVKTAAIIILLAMLAVSHLAATAEKSKLLEAQHEIKQLKSELSERSAELKACQIHEQRLYRTYSAIVRRKVELERKLSELDKYKNLYVHLKRKYKEQVLKCITLKVIRNDRKNKLLMILSGNLTAVGGKREKAN